MLATAGQIRRGGKPAQPLARLHTVNKTLLVTCVIGLAATGCAGHTAAGAEPKTSPSHACGPADHSCIPADHPTATAGASTIPAAHVGQPLPIQFQTETGTVQMQFTLTGMPTRPRTSVDAKGTKEFCFGFKLRNVGTLSAGEVTAGFGWKWFGLDGEQVESLDAGTAGVCDDLGHQFAGLDHPAPSPGKFVAGYYSFLIPTKPGAVEVTDSQGTPLFRLNYGPRSAQVPIGPKGQ